MPAWAKVEKSEREVERAELQIQGWIFGAYPSACVAELQGVRASGMYSSLYSSSRDSANFVLQNHYYGPINLASISELDCGEEFAQTNVFPNRSYSQLM